MWRSLFLLPERQELCRFYVQHGCQIEQEVQRDGAAEVRGFDCAQVLAADADELRELLLRQPGVLAVIGDVVAELDELLCVVEYGVSGLCHVSSPLALFYPVEEKIKIGDKITLDN